MKRGVLLSAGTALALLLILQPDSHVRIITTDSTAAAGIYWQSAGLPRRGALVLACLTPATAQFGLARSYLAPGDCPAGAEPVAKIVGALPGDIVDIEPQWVAVNGSRFLNSASADRDSAGRPLPHVSFGTRLVGPGEVWLFGFNNNHSWDARYYGSTPLTSVLGNLEAVTTW
jgi:conjugative transfer signal peptidase TraF